MTFAFKTGLEDFSGLFTVVDTFDDPQDAVI